MILHDGETTDGALLERLGDWADAEAWGEFVRRYDPTIRRHVGRYRFAPDSAEDLCQRIWVELAGRMRGYRCEPGGRFRAWLGRLCRSRAVDHWRRERRESERRAGPLPDPGPADDAADVARDEQGPGRPALLREADRVQRAVRARVDARTWEAFWRVAVEDERVGDAAEALGLSYAAAFAAQKRVRRMLREEAARAGVGPRP